MARFHYKAVDWEGRPISGEIEAVSSAEVVERLTLRGCTVKPDDIWEAAPEEAAGGRLSSDEAVEVSGQIAQMMKTGLALAPGLRAMAEELPSRRVARMLRQIASLLDAGFSLETALEAQGKRFPSHLRGLILAAARSGQLAEPFEEFVAIQGRRVELRRRVWMTLAYPLVLLGMLLVMFLFCSTVLMPGFLELFEGFGIELPVATQLLIAITRPGVVLGLFGSLGGLVVAMLVLQALRSHVAWAQRVCDRVPVLGPAGYWGRLAEFAQIMGVLLRQQVPLPTALRWAGGGLGDANLAAGCRRLAEMVERGGALAECLPQVRPFPPGLRPVIQWGENLSALAEAFQAAAEMFEGRRVVQTRLLEVITLPITLLVVISSISLAVFALYLPLHSLVERLI